MTIEVSSNGIRWTEERKGGDAQEGCWLGVEMMDAMGNSG
jgi:hypothetical protein